MQYLYVKFLQVEGGRSALAEASAYWRSTKYHQVLDRGGSVVRPGVQASDVLI